MQKSKYVEIPIVLDSDFNPVSVWDKKVSFKKDDYYGNSVLFNGERVDVVTAYMDLKTKEISLGEEIIRISEDTTFKVGEEVYVEIPYHVNKVHRQIASSIIKEIIQEKVDHFIINKGNELDDYEQQKIENFDPDKIYSIKYIKPTYLLEDGTKVEWEHQLYKKKHLNPL